MIWGCPYGSRHSSLYTYFQGRKQNAPRNWLETTRQLENSAESLIGWNHQPWLHRLKVLIHQFSIGWRFSTFRWEYTVFKISDTAGNWIEASLSMVHLRLLNGNELDLGNFSEVAVAHWVPFVWYLMLFSLITFSKIYSVHVSRNLQKCPTN